MRRNAAHFARQYLTLGIVCVSCLFGPPSVSSAQDLAQDFAQQTPSQLPSAAKPAQQPTEVKAALHQELKDLLDENLKINKEKKALLEHAEQKTFWIQCLVFFLTAIMIITLVSFWRFHAQRIFRRGMDEITTSLRSFQDSIISFIDTTQLDPATAVSSFRAQTAPQTEPPMAPRLTPEISTPTQEKSSSDFTPPTEVTNTTKGFFDAWLRVYKPGGDAIKQAELALKNKPQSPEIWLQMINSFRSNNDYFHFESLRTEIKKFFNIKIDHWSETEVRPPRSVADYPHVQQKIFEAWPGSEIVTVLERLLLNSRLSAREGFDQTLYQHLEKLLALAKDPQRPLRALELKEHPAGAFLFVAPTNADETRPSEPQQKIRVLARPPERLVPQQAQSASTTPPVATSSVPASVATPAPSEIKPERKLAATPPDHKILHSAYEVRLKLALAYLDIGDAEGACLLLQDVISDAPPDQQTHARKLLNEIEAKREKTKEVWID